MNELLLQFPAKYDISFFVPCLNEEGNVGLTLQNIISVANESKYNFEILVFDDNSADGSVEEIMAVAEKFPSANIRLIKNERRRGLARNYCDGAYIGLGKHYMLVNGDNAEPTESIRSILSQLGKADMIIPVFAGNDSRTSGRKLLSRTFTSIVNFVSGFSISYYNGPVLHRRVNVMRWHADTDGFAYQAEIITRLLQEGASYLEVTIKNQDRSKGQSKALSFKNFLAISHSLTQILIRRVRYLLFYRKTYERN